MKIFKTDFNSLAEAYQQYREDLIVRVFFLTEDDEDFAIFYVNTLTDPEPIEFAYKFTDSFAWVCDDFSTRISSEFPKS